MRRSEKSESDMARRRHLGPVEAPVRDEEVPAGESFLARTGTDEVGRLAGQQRLIAGDEPDGRKALFQHAGDLVGEGAHGRSIVAIVQRLQECDEIVDLRGRQGAGRSPGLRSSGISLTLTAQVVERSVAEVRRGTHRGPQSSAAATHQGGGDE